ncbi:MAG: MFS transporter [Actinomyces sp.]|uniref:MFS transporter n=1 Tax=Actinomyces sp. TaxID=29317 RepID=UPI0026DD4530|nr:MFS transporter [Actinomyces sp.]MDO4243452.1 MFS transporter [Actinomyces sp.]
MTTDNPRRPRALVKARVAVYLTFLANGLGFSNLVPRYPEILEDLGMTKSAFGQAVMFGSIGALVAGLAASWLITRLTSARVASIGMMVLGLGLLGAGVADSWPAFAVCLAWVGGVDAIVDVAQNAHGLRVERRWGGSIITSFHAAWSLGAVLGATMGQVMAGAGVPVALHMALVLALLSVVAGLALPWTIKGPDSQDREGLLEGDLTPPGRVTPGAEPASARSRPVTVAIIIVLGLMCAAAMFPEDVAGSWSSLLLAEQGAAPGAVGMGLVSLQGTMIVGRLVGDVVIDRLGPRRVIGGGGLLVAVGMVIALVLGSVPGTLIGMVIAGVGCAVAVPVAYAAADDIPGLRPGQGLTIVSWLARVIMLVSPPVIGWFADAHGTWVALVYGLVGGAILAISWPVLRRRSPARAAS